jgi:hypothetical protein
MEEFIIKVEYFRKNHAVLDILMMKIEMLSFHLNHSIAWILNESTCRWEAPVAMPTDGNKYILERTNLSWDLTEI